MATRVTRRAAVRGAAAGVALVAAALSIQMSSPVAAVSGTEQTPPLRVRTAYTFVAATRLPSEFTLPAPLHAVPLDASSGFDLPIGRFRATFIPRAGLLGPDGNPDVLLKEPLVIGMVITCLDKIWWIESEPAGGRAFNMVAYAAGAAPGEQGLTAILSGQGTVAADGGKLVNFALQTASALVRSVHQDQIVAAITSQPDGSYGGRVDVIESQDKSHGYCHHRCKNKSGTAHRKCRKRCRKHRRH